MRSSILYATVLVILVFIPLLGTGGHRRATFAPIAIATMMSMAASFAVSLTLIPVLCSLLLPSMKRMQEEKGQLHRPSAEERQVGGYAAAGIRQTLAGYWGSPQSPWRLLSGALARMGVEFLPTFNEGSAIISMVSAPGASLGRSESHRAAR